MRAVVVVVLALFAVPALAGQKARPAPAAAPSPAGTPDPAPVSAPSGMEGRKPTDVLRFEPLVIEGRTQAPQAVRVLKRADVSFSDLLPPESLLPRIAEAVESEPF